MLGLKGRADRSWLRTSTAYQLRRKREAEVTYWRQELVHLDEWFRAWRRGSPRTANRGLQILAPPPDTSPLFLGS